MSKRITIFVLLLFCLAFLTADTGQALAADSTLYWGSRGDNVVKLQQTLNKWGYWCGNADGIFGAKTYSAVIRFQRDHGISTTGTVGPKTRQALGLSNVQTGSTVSRGGAFSVIATGYCGCTICNYPYGGQPAYNGMPLQYGIVAVDPTVIPMNTRLYIDGYGEAIAADQGNAIKGYHIDLYFPSHEQALDWGIKRVNVTIL
ncbi:MAG: peptidoglycan-binding protein [Deltaproteobacteria bacterium]